MTSLSNAQTISTSKESVYGCLPVNETIFVKQTEVSIADWFAFIYHENIEAAFEMEEGLQEVILSSLPDSILETNKFVYEIFTRTWGEDIDLYKVDWQYGSASTFPLLMTKKEKKEHKSRIKMILNMPVTGLNYFQLEKFVEWQSTALDELLKDDATYSHRVQLIPVDVYDSLIARNIAGFAIELTKDGIPASIGDSTNLKGCHLFNFKGSQDCPASEGRIERYGTDIGPVEVYSYHPDINGFYTLLGNVAEMTAEKGVAKGGHFDMYAKEILSISNTPYTEPSSLIGFRYMVTLIRN